MPSDPAIVADPLRRTYQSRGESGTAARDVMHAAHAPARGAWFGGSHVTTDTNLRTDIRVDPGPPHDDRSGSMGEAPPATADRRAPTSIRDLARLSDYFAVAATRRFRASERGRLRAAERHGMFMVMGAAVLDCLWLAPLHPDSLWYIVVLNLTLAALATAAYVAMTTRARRHPEPFVFLVLVAVDLGTMALGFSRPDLWLVVTGYMLMLPMIVALAFPWATRIHVGWLALHGAAVVTYTFFTPHASLAGGAPGDVITLLVVASAASQLGHFAALRSRVLSFVQIERIRALNRLARRDETRLDRLNRILEQTARTDELTGLKNRLSLKLDLGVIRARIARHREVYALLVLDLDRFKTINDTRGHVAGDGVLRAIAESLMEAVRVGDGAYRYGGEEFVLLMRLTRPEEAGRAAERIRRAVEDLGLAHAGNPPHRQVTVSIGVATIGPEDLGADDDAWFAMADAALYRAKANGRNRCEGEMPSSPSSDAA